MIIVILTNHVFCLYLLLFIRGLSLHIITIVIKIIIVIIIIIVAAQIIFILNHVPQLVFNILELLA